MSTRFAAETRRETQRLTAYLRAQEAALLDDRAGRRAEALEGLAKAAVAYPLRRWDVFAVPLPDVPEDRPRSRLLVAPALVLVAAVAVLVLPWRLGATAATAAPLVITALAQFGFLNEKGKEASAAVVTAFKASGK